MLGQNPVDDFGKMDIHLLHGILVHQKLVKLQKDFLHLIRQFHIRRNHRFEHIIDDFPVFYGQFSNLGKILN